MSENVLFNHCNQLLEGGQPGSALLIIEALCEEFPGCLDYELLKVKTLFALRDYDNVLRITSKFISLIETEVGIHTIEGIRLGMMAALELGEIKKCLLFCSKIMVFNKVLGHCYAGKCAELEGNPEIAAQHYSLALESNPFCGEAIDGMIARQLLSPLKLLQLIDKLNLQHVENLRGTYRAKVPVYTLHQLGNIPTSLKLLHQTRKERYENNLEKAYDYCLELLKLKPFSKDAVCLFLSILVDMKSSQKIFEYAQALSRRKTRPELALYAIGCFYYTILNFEKAGRYFIRAKEMDPYFPEAHVAYGHCYARLEESEEAKKVYEKAVRLFPGLHHCSVYLGMQFSRKDQWDKAEREFRKATDAVPSDPVALNELGVIYFTAKNYRGAHKLFLSAYMRLPNPQNPSEYHDCIVFNLATSFRKLRMYPEASEYYSQYIKYRPKASCGYFALGLTFHLSGDLGNAIMYYENAQRIKYDSVCAAMLENAVDQHKVL